MTMAFIAKHLLRSSLGCRNSSATLRTSLSAFAVLAFPDRIVYFVGASTEPWCLDPPLRPRLCISCMVHRSRPICQSHIHMFYSKDAPLDVYVVVVAFCSFIFASSFFVFSHRSSFVLFHPTCKLNINKGPSVPKLYRALCLQSLSLRGVSQPE